MARRAAILLASLAALAGCGDGSGDSTTGTGPAPPDGGGDQRVGDAAGDVTLRQLGEFEQPVYVTEAPGDPRHLYVVEQCGRVKRIPAGGGPASTFLDISELVTCGGEQGLLSVAFAPDYARSGHLYVNYTGLDEDSHTVEYRRSADRATADPATARELLRIDDFASNHNGGLLLFGPDRELYLGMGDGGGSGDPNRTAQDPDSPLGKLLRIHRGRTPAATVAALGLRNPWRYSFDRRTGDLWIGDVGQDEVEEIDALPAARFERAAEPPNFGWSAFEGTSPFNADQSAPNAIAPVLEYGHGEGGCSVTGGYVVRDRGLPSLYGRYLYGDFCVGKLRSFTADPGRPAADDRALGLEVPSLSSFGEDAAGHVYAVSLEGPVYRLVGG